MRRALVFLLLLSVVPLPTAAAQEPQPVLKRCVGDPPRQTEDPMSPPCVASFQGDNGGATSRGVTADEARVVFYRDGVTNAIHDLSGPSQPCLDLASDCASIEVLRSLMRWGNERHQTYGRHIHGFTYGSSGNVAGDVTDIDERLRPFAVVVQTGGAEAHDAFNDLGVMTFSSDQFLSRDTMASADPYGWSFWPDDAAAASNGADYVCSKLAGRPARHSGNAIDLGRERHFRIYASDARVAYATLLAGQLNVRCGVRAEVLLAPDASDPLDVLLSFLTFQLAITDGVTTLLHVAGPDPILSHQLALLGWFPEIVLMDDLEVMSNVYGRLQNRAVWSHAFGPTAEIRIDSVEGSYGNLAYRDGCPSCPDAARTAHALYRDVFLLFGAIQGAGAPLTATSVASGLRALPGSASADPYAAAYSFSGDDHSGVDDAMEVWWDPSGLAPGALAPGCLRMVDDGARHGPGDWPAGDDGLFVNGRCVPDR